MLKKIIFYFTLFIFSSVFSSSNHTTLGSNDSNRRGLMVHDFDIEGLEKSGLKHIRSCSKEDYTQGWLNDNDSYLSGFIDVVMRLRAEHAIKNNSYVPFNLYVYFLENHHIPVSRALSARELDSFRNFLVEDHIQQIRARHRDLAMASFKMKLF